MYAYLVVRVKIKAGSSWKWIDLEGERERKIHHVHTRLGEAGILARSWPEFLGGWDRKGDIGG